MVYSSEQENGHSGGAKISSLCLLIDHAYILAVSNGCGTLKIAASWRTGAVKKKNLLLSNV